MRRGDEPRNLPRSCRFPFGLSSVGTPSSRLGDSLATGLCVSKLGRGGGEGEREREEGGGEREIWKYVVSKS